MRLRRVIACVVPAWLALQAADTGLPPRSSPDAYTAHQITPVVTFGASRLKPDQVAKIFSPDIDRNYVVVEVGVYPRDGATIDIRDFDFALRFSGGQETRPDTPQEAGAIWREKRGNNGNVNVTTETGVFVGTQKDPVNGRRTTTVGTYEGVGVAVGDPGPSAPRTSGPDPRLIQDRLEARALPEGKTSKAVGGYLYFARPPRKPKDASLNLKYSRDNVSADLALPAK